MIWQAAYLGDPAVEKRMDHNESIVSPEITRDRRNGRPGSDWDGFNSEAMPYLPDLHRTANWLTRNKEDAEDLVQETLFNAMRSFQQYQRGTNCRAWLMTIMYNLNARRLSKLNRMKFIDDPDGLIARALPFFPSPSDDTLDTRLLTGLRKMPDYFREAVVMSDVHEYSYREISSVLSVPIGTVMSRISRGRQILRKELSGVINNQESSFRPQNSTLLR